MITSALNPWVTRSAPRPDATTRLFCLPYAGAGAGAFRGWAEALGRLADVEVLPIRLPGRESRLAEPPQTDIGELTDAIADCMDRTTVLFGHSVGARMAFEVSRELRRRGRPLPAALLVSGCPAPQLPVECRDDSTLDDEAFARRVLGMGGIPEAILADPELRDLLMPAIRADFGYVDHYRYTAGPPLPMPITAFSGDRDPEAPPPAVQQWSEQSSAAFRHHTLPGNHFFLHSSVDPLQRMISTAIAEVNRSRSSKPTATAG
ncbi:thioesterase II family protein [Microlunatus soli]|uniref:Surfactin synthase thioesterase subunit n=1 Tax=Microlunatus soli TaxID=630515 RepID=A0A1H1VVP0_9ACTN|nr:alpha/beta fold hydrolase [Microlunatus soli]SDS88551.1 Surfactin synthase thioesterase subunit [Microlunatus soli]